jgi:hypothetical protein
MKIHMANVLERVREIPRHMFNRSEVMRVLRELEADASDPHDSGCPCFRDHDSSGARVFHDKKCANCMCD